MRKSFIAFILFAIFCTQAFGQVSNATVSGTIEDPSKAVLPGVTITATNTATGVNTTVVSNEAGAYNLPSLLPGPYKISAELPGFQMKTYEVTLGNAQTVRLNFALNVAGVGTAVEVSVPVDTLLATSSASVGEVLSESKLKDLPLVGNNALFLLNTLAGTRMDDNGVTGTFAGMTNYNVNVTRDGVDASASARYMQAGIQTATMLNPDLIGELRLIVAPVDAEMGRGNGQMIVQTKSGTNQFRGSAVWDIRNSALDSNYWTNNKQVDPKTGTWKPVPLDWNNRHQYTISAGGPIIKNKTFFFGLWDGLINNRRTIQNSQVLTPCAANGIFRYFDNWNNGNAIQTTSLGATPTIQAVDSLGNPLAPATNPDGSPANGILRYTSVFGKLPANLPAANADCSNIAALVQAGTNWDPFRKAVDSTGFVNKLLPAVSSPNNYELGDGLNTANLRWVRHERGGNENLFGFADTGLFGGIDRKQLNIKIDHNFNATNKLAVTYTYERDDGLANLMTLPNTFTGSTYRRPHQLAVNYVSTLSASTVNEFRVGLRRTSGSTFNALYDPQYTTAAKAYYPSASGIPIWIGLGQAAGQVNFQATQPLGSGTTSSYQDITKLWSYGDTLSWTKSKHSFKVGGEMRRQSSWAKDTGVGTTAVPRALGGDAPLAAISTTAISTTNMPGLGGTATTGNNARMRQLLSFLSGSLSSITQAYYMQSPTKLDAFEDYRTFPSRIRDYHENEFSLFFKDDWKFTDNLTLNLGLRYDWYGSPYEASGLMPLPIGGGYSIFGISGRSFSNWMQPGARADNTTLQFVGKNSPNPGISWYPNNYKNFGPAVGFAWQVPWFGASKTTVRGGYQITYQIGESFNNLFQEQNVPGSIYNATYTGDSNITYLDLTKLNSVVPLPVPIKPMQAIPITDRSQSLYVPDPALRTPYAQNLTLAITRSVTSKVTVDLRYVGTLARLQRSASNNINVPNFLYNGLKEAFDAVRAGGESPLLDQMLNGVNLGAGTVGQNGFTGAAALRADSRFNTNLANGNYQSLAASLNTLNYSSALNPTLPAFPANVQGTVMRVNGFPENFIVTNPQFSTINWISDNASNNYHSFNAQVTVRPTNGITWQSTYIWSKNLGINGLIGGGLGTTFTNPVDRHKDYALLPDTRVHDFRTNGTLALPIGPGKLLFSNSSGFVARIIEGWQTSAIVNLNTGQPLSIVAQSMLYANGTPDVVGPFNLKSAHVQFTGGPNGYYFAPGTLKQVSDPHCGTVSANLKSLCSLSAVADAKSGQILLQNPLPGTRGTLGQRVLEGPGRWRFDASLAKAIKLTESKNLQFRMDAQNVLNHPEPQLVTTGASLINVDINAPNFGLITGPQAKSNTNRQFQVQLRLNF